MNSQFDPDVTLSKEDDDDVAGIEVVLEEAQDKEAAQRDDAVVASQQPAPSDIHPIEGVVMQRACRPPQVAIPIDHSRWIGAQAPPLVTFPPYLI